MEEPQEEWWGRLAPSASWMKEDMTGVEYQGCLGIPYIPLNEPAFRLLSAADVIGGELVDSSSPSFQAIQAAFVEAVVSQGSVSPYSSEGESEALQRLYQWSVPQQAVPGAVEYLAGVNNERPSLPTDRDTGQLPLLLGDRFARNLQRWDGDIREEIWHGNPEMARKGALTPFMHPRNYALTSTTDPYTRLQVYSQGRVHNPAARRKLLERLRSIRKQVAQRGFYRFTREEQTMYNEKKNRESTQQRERENVQKQLRKVQEIMEEWRTSHPDREEWAVRMPPLGDTVSFTHTTLFPFFWDARAILDGSEDPEALPRHFTYNLAHWIARNPLLVETMVREDVPFLNQEVVDLMSALRQDHLEDSEEVEGEQSLSHKLHQSLPELADQLLHWMSFFLFLLNHYLSKVVENDAQGEEELVRWCVKLFLGDSLEDMRERPFSLYDLMRSPCRWVFSSFFFRHPSPAGAENRPDFFRQLICMGAA